MMWGGGGGCAKGREVHTHNWERMTASPSPPPDSLHPPPACRPPLSCLLILVSTWTIRTSSFEWSAQSSLSPSPPASLCFLLPSLAPVSLPLRISLFFLFFSAEFSSPEVRIYFILKDSLYKFIMCISWELYFPFITVLHCIFTYFLYFFPHNFFTSFFVFMSFEKIRADLECCILQPSSIAHRCNMCVCLFKCFFSLAFSLFFHAFRRMHTHTQTYTLKFYSSLAASKYLASNWQDLTVTVLRYKWCCLLKSNE